MDNDAPDPVGSGRSVDKSKKGNEKTKEDVGINSESTINPYKQREPLKTGWEALLKLDKKVQAQRPIGHWESKWPNNVGNKKTYNCPPRTKKLLSTLKIQECVFW